MQKKIFYLYNFVIVILALLSILLVMLKSLEKRIQK